MKGFAFITAALFAGQAFSIPSYSQQHKRDNCSNTIEELEEEAFGIWANACYSLNIPHYYCTNHIWEKCVRLWNDAIPKVQNRQWCNKEDLKVFEADVKACLKPRDPATDAGLCYDQNLSGEACQKYAKEFREKNKFVLGIEQADKPLEPPKAAKRPNCRRKGVANVEI
ncbi:hypothetical protein X797_010618 [Metarhizium robertsii]|uniref:Uncharacterized protein n=1 Tax=Metarhizium robertsii TaxID=568076 RepID=A0A0A1UP13_9HYPO|nr:hypothetical protein X797_010618 [Metarhizium robertsii]